MSLQMAKGFPDIGRERDFVDRAPSGPTRADMKEFEQGNCVLPIAIRNVG